MNSMNSINILFIVVSLAAYSLVATYFFWMKSYDSRSLKRRIAGVKADISKLKPSPLSLRRTSASTALRTSAKPTKLRRHKPLAPHNLLWRRRATQAQTTNYGYSISHPVFPGLAYVSDVIRTAGGGRSRGEGATLVAYPDKHLRDCLPGVGLRHTLST